MHKAAKQNNAELWMYNCWVTGAGYLQERFYSGLWTWRTVAAGKASGKAGAAVKNAKAFLDELRARIPYSAYKQRLGGISQNQWAELDAWNPVPEIKPEDYARIRDDCAKHIIAIRKECGL